MCEGVEDHLYWAAMETSSTNQEPFRAQTDER